ETHPRHCFAGRRHSTRTVDQGADTRRFNGADRLAHRAAADPAPADRRRASRDRAGLVVPDCGRSHRRRFRPRLPHLSRAAVFVDGRDPALRGVDHAARLPHGSRPAHAPAQGLSVVRASEGGMSAIVFDKVWKEYGDHVVLEQIDLKIEPRAFLALVGPSGCGKTTFLRMLLGEERPTRGAILLDDKPLKPEPD